MKRLSFSAPAAWVGCPRCKTRVPCHDPAGSRYFGCWHCRAFFAASAAAPGRRARLVTAFRWVAAAGPSLPLGAVAELGGYRCRVVGYQVRGERQDPQAEWHAYQLRPAEPTTAPVPADFPHQLVEHRGHWLLFRQVQALPAWPGPHPTQAGGVEDATGRPYRIWRRYRPVIRDARGEFDHNLLHEEALELEEYIAPPYLLVGAQLPGQAPTWFRAESLAAVQVATAFNLRAGQLPAQLGIGAAQPGPADPGRGLRRLAGVAVGLLTLLQFALLALRPARSGEQEFVVSEPDAGCTDWVFTSRSFALRHQQALQISLNAPDLYDHWVRVQAQLVNEQTGRRYQFTRRLAHYSSPGPAPAYRPVVEASASLLLGAVPAGRYHFTLTPTLEAGTGAVVLQLYLRENPPLWGNYLLVLSLLLLPPLVGWARHNFHERLRWHGNVYSPYQPTT